MGCVCEDMCTNYKTFVRLQQTASKTGKPQEAGTGSVRLDMRLCEEEGGGVLWGGISLGFEECIDSKPHSRAWPVRLDQLVTTQLVLRALRLDL